MAKPYPENLKTKAGVGLMTLSQTAATGFISSYLMLYITDYSGLYTGVAGGAAAAATLMLLIGRIWDGINDPLIGYIMDRTPRTRYGRYKPYAVVAIPVIAVLIILLFNVPSGFADPAKLLWLYLIYFLFDTALTAIPFAPLVQSMTTDTRIRGQLYSWQRVLTLVASMGTASFIIIAIALGPDGVTPNISLAMIIFMVPLSLLSMLGIILTKEGTATAQEEQIRFKDLLTALRVNKSLWVYLLSQLIGGFVWTMMFGGISYYIKYAFGPENFGTASMITGAASISSLLAGVFIAQPLMKRATPAWWSMWFWIVCAAPLAVLFLINLSGPITSMPLLFVLLFLSMLGVGAGYVPGSVVGLDAMDYNRVVLGKSMGGSLSSIFLMTQKLQAAVAVTVTGGILVAIGYDASKYENADNIPPELFGGLGIAIFGLPAVLSVLAGVTLLLHPMLKKEKRDEILGALRTTADETGLPDQELR